MSSDKLNYIGITGINMIYQMDVLKKIWLSLNEDFKIPYKLMTGFLVSYKQLIDRNYGKIGRNINFPYGELITNLHKYNCPQIMKAIHYHTRNNTAFDEEIDIMMEEIDNNVKIDGIQLNISDPDPKCIKKIKQKWKIDIILQLNNSFLNKLKRRYFDFWDKDIFNQCEFVLIDSSGGRGKESLTYEEITDIYCILNELGFHNKIGLAGGLCGSNVQKYLFPFKGISIDAESKLRNNQNELDLNECRLYLKNAFDQILLNQRSSEFG